MQTQILIPVLYNIIYCNTNNSQQCKVEDNQHCTSGEPGPSKLKKSSSASKEPKDSGAKPRLVGRPKKGKTLESGAGAEPSAEEQGKKADAGGKMPRDEKGNKGDKGKGGKAKKAAGSEEEATGKGKGGPTKGGGVKLKLKIKRKEGKE